VGVSPHREGAESGDHRFLPMMEVRPTTAVSPDRRDASTERNVLAAMWPGGAVSSVRILLLF